MESKVKVETVLFLKLIKITVTLPVTFLAYSAYIIYNGSHNLQLILCCLGVFLLAGASSALNQLVEKKFDSKMERTKNRPIASGKVSSSKVLFISAIMVIAGFMALWYLSVTSAVLGIITLLWYIYVYTKLKRVTPLAVIPGSVVGALPILIGFTAAGASITNPVGIFLGLFVFIWQIPHFWLLVLFYGADYEKAGYPTLFRVFSEYQIRLWTLGWIIASALVAMAIPLFGLVHSAIAVWGITSINIFLIVLSAKLLLKQTSKLKLLFHVINLFMMFVLLFVMFEKLGLLN